MPGDSTSSTANTSQAVSAYDVAQNLAPQGDVAGSIINLNVAGINMRGTQQHKRAKAGKGEGSASVGAGDNSGLQFNLLDGGVINKAFGFAELMAAKAANSSESVIEILSSQLSKDRSAQLAPNLEGQGMRNMILGVLGLAVVAVVGVKMFKGNGA